MDPARVQGNEFWGGWGIDTVAVIYAACKVRALEGPAAMKGNPRAECLIILAAYSGH